MLRKRRYRLLGGTLLSAVLLLNAIAFFHAYRFTHFDPASGPKVTHAGQLPLTEKLSMLFTGAPNPRPQPQHTPGHPFETVRLHSNKEIECWYLPADSAKGTVALFHGYGGEKSTLLDKAAVFRSLGYHTLLVDFMGAGGSEGNQTTIGYKEADQVATSVCYLQQRGEQNIVLFGTSLGAAAVMKALHDEALPVRSVILECPFATLQQAVENRFKILGVPPFPMAHLLLFWGGVQNGFNAFAHDPVDYARAIKCPTLLLYGEKDVKVTAEETAAIFAALAGPKKLVTYPLAGHENYLKKYREKWTLDVAAYLSAP